MFRVDECLAEIRECLERGWTGLGFKTTEFEEQWKRYTGLPHGHFVNSATAGLHLAVRLLKDRFGWREDDEIISTPLSFVSDEPRDSLRGSPAGIRGRRRVPVPRSRIGCLAHRPRGRGR
jgi:hypothetical protein